MPAPEFCALGGVEFCCAFCADTAVVETRIPAATKPKIALMALPTDALPCERNAARCEAFRCGMNYLSRAALCATARWKARRARDPTERCRHRGISIPRQPARIIGFIGRVCRTTVPISTP